MQYNLRKIGAAILLVVFMFVIASPDVFAQNAIRKLGRGLANFTTGFLELPINIVDAAEEDGYIAAVTYGIVKGLAMSVLRTGIGMYETVTFLIPLPFDYEVMLEPEFLLGEESF